MNDMTISQAATILGEAVEQATGQKVITNISTPEQFVSVAQTALKPGMTRLLTHCRRFGVNPFTQCAIIPAL